MIISGQLLVPGSPSLSGSGAGIARAELRPGWLRLEAGKIAEMHLGEPRARPDLGGEDCLITPGFTDIHLHLPQFDCIGQGGLTLLDWLHRVVFPAEARWADADYAGQMATTIARQLIGFGTTRVAAYATVHHAAAQKAIDALGAAGLKGHVGQVLMERNAPDELCRPGPQLIAEAAALRPAGGIQPSVNPRFAVSCGMELLAASAQLAKSTGRLIQTHYAEMLAECALVRELFDGRSYTEVYREAGLLTRRTILAHAVYTSDADRRALRDAGAMIAHCPTANNFLRSGRMDWPALEAIDAAVGLGTDVAGGPERSMVRVARAALENRAELGRAIGVADTARVWAQITWLNAALLGDGLGSVLARGASPEVLVIRPDIRWRDLPDPLGALLWAWDDRWIRTVLIDGAPVHQA
ncbi:MAG: amidohydrolase family protein [Phycisphaerales bacterium]